MSAVPEPVQVHIARMLARMSTAWAEHDFDTLRELWSLAPEPIVYLAEEAEFARSRLELEDYWARTAAGIHEVRANYVLDSVACLSAELYVATFRNEWAARDRPGDEMIAGTCRGMLIVEALADGIRPRIYVEAPMAPLLYIRELYKLVARTRGLA
jgi:hypothetical protein